ncbi:MAG: S9 family peptidase [bacterium]
MMKRFLFVLSFCLLPFSSPAQDHSLLTVERIFSSDEFAAKRFGPARWLEKGAGYTTLEPSKTIENGTDIVRYDTRSGQREILVGAEKLIPGDAKYPLEIADYQWSNDKKNLLIFTNTKKVWRYHTRGDYWVLNLQTWKLKKLGGPAKPSTLMFAKFAPDGRRVSYVREKNIYVEDITSGKIVQLTFDGLGNIINGTSDWVYEEEFGLRDGFRWSPDSRHIAYWHFDANGIGTFYMINNTDSLYPKLIPLQYPKVGTTNSACSVGVVSAEGGETTWFKVPGDARNHYIPKMEWAASSEEVVIQQLNRLQNTNKVMLGKISDGSVTTILTEKDDAWLDVNDDLKWFDHGRQFTWLSERDGWRHLYIVSRNGEKVKLLTPGEYDIVTIQKIDTASGWVYFIASPDNPTQRYLYRVNLDGDGKAERLTPQDQPGTHSYQIAPGGRLAFHTYSTFDTPPVVSLISLPGHEQVRILESNSALHKKVAELDKQPTEFFRVKIEDDVELDAWFIKPPDFDPSKKYPLFFYVYGEPAGQTVLDKWFGHRTLWHHLIAQQGYLVMSVDNRGTPAPRGRDWRKSIYRQIGILASQDQAAAAKAIIKTRTYVDKDRIGIWGWSGGGQMTLNMLFRYPEIYHTGIAVSFVSDQRLYDTIYQERYMGLPDDNEAGYTNGSPITFAHRLKGNLLIIHGTGDDNVHYQSFERMVNELIKHNKKFTMMSYPNRSHSLSEGENTKRHLYELMLSYLMENLPPGAKSKAH